MANIAKICGKAKERALSWYPWISNNHISLDADLVNQLSSGRCSQINAANAIIMLRWFSNVPDGFLSERDFEVAGWIAEKLPANLSI